MMADTGPAAKRFVGLLALMWASLAAAQDPAIRADADDAFFGPLGGFADEETTQRWQDSQLTSSANAVFGEGFESRVDYLVRVFQPRPVLIATDAPPAAPHTFTGNIAEIKGAQPTLTYESVGMLMSGQNDATTDSHCTVFLIDSDTVLTARHCVLHTHGDQFWTYFAHEGVRQVVGEPIFFCQSDDDCDVDLAVLKLDEPYVLIRPQKQGSNALANIGDVSTIVGFGLSDPELADYGVKRAGPITLQACNNFLNDGQSLCFGFGMDVQIANNKVIKAVHANCNNDSGGPMTSSPAGEENAIGVASQRQGECDGSGEGRYVNATHQAFYDWLNSFFCDPNCLGLVGRTQAAFEPLRYMDESNPVEQYSFDLADGYSRLIVTLNHGRGWYPWPNRIELGLSEELDGKCRRFVETEVCIVDTPPGGAHTISVNRQAGAAFFQLSAVAVVDTMLLRPNN